MASGVREITFADGVLEVRGELLPGGGFSIRDFGPFSGWQAAEAFSSLAG